MAGKIIFRYPHKRLLKSVRSCVLTDSFDNVDETNYRFFSSNNWETKETSHNQNYMKSVSLLGLGIGISFGIYYSKHGDKTRLFAASQRTKEVNAGEPVPGLPLYSLQDVGQHCSKNDQIWVTYKQGVYNITSFVEEHPGGDKIMMAAGGSVEPFWLMYGVHNQPEILAMLEKYRIGNLSLEESQESIRDLEDPYGLEPKRHPSLRINSQKPFNAEPPPSLLADSFITPVDLFYVRNHLPVPLVDVNEWRLTIEGVGFKSIELSMDQIKKFPKHTVTTAVQCAGNRRSEMSKVKKVKGLDWGTAAIGNATFSGAKLYDVLKAAGLKDDEIRAQHVQFEGLDTDPANVPYAASIPIEKAMDPKGDVLLAYEMNGAPLNRDHGFPLRAVVPGVVGARNVKWLGAIYVSEEESPSHWQQNDYKGFSPSVDWDTVDFTKSPAIQQLPVTSAICEPLDNDEVLVKDGKITVKGYACSGGGNKIVRVDVTPDCGQTWYVAELTNPDKNKPPHHWAWSLWQVEIPIRKGDKQIQLWAKAVDSSYNTQPESFTNIWNLRGVLSNAYHRINIKLKH